MSEPATPLHVQVTPTPTNEEMAAIMAAYRGLWPVEEAASAPASASTAWRFSGRWWMQGQGAGQGQRGPALGWQR